MDIGDEKLAWLTMKLDIELPFAFRGRPKGCRDIRDIFLTKTVTVEVAEVAKSETGVAFSVAKRTLAGSEDGPDGPWLQARLNAVKSEKRQKFVMRTFQGTLYRKIANSVSEAFELGLFSTPFEHRNSGRRDRDAYGVPAWQSEYGGDISVVRAFRDNGPLSRPLLDEMSWIMDRDRPHCDGARSSWPPAPSEPNRAYNFAYHAHRNARTFEEEISRITEIDWSSMAAAEQMVDTQTVRLLLIDGEVWIKSRPPAIAVDYEFRWKVHNQLRLRLVTAPEVYVSKLSCAHFSLADMEAAREYAASQSSDRRQIVDNLLPYEYHDPALLDYDWRGEAINRFSYTAAVECRNFLARNPEKGDKVTSDERAVIANAFEETMNVNHILGIHRDMSEFALDLKSAWKKLGYRQCLEVGITAAGVHAEPAASNIEALLDEAPIAPPLGMAHHTDHLRV